MSDELKQGAASGGADDTRSAGPAEDAVGALYPTATGRWLVRTRGSVHVFDLDEKTYLRRPGPGHGRFDYDGTSVRLTRVERWPRVGGTFFIWVDDHRYPDLIEHWHQSSQVHSIIRLSRDAGLPDAEDPQAG